MHLLITPSIFKIPSPQNEGHFVISNLLTSRLEVSKKVYLLEYKVQLTPRSSRQSLNQIIKGVDQTVREEKKTLSLIDNMIFFTSIDNI